MASQEERDRIMAEYLASVEQDDDDDDEAEFDPNGDEDEDDDEDGQDEVITMQGKLTVVDKHLVYKGKTSQDEEFAINSQPLHFNLSTPTEISANAKDDPPKMRSIMMEGLLEGKTCKVDLTITKTSKSTVGSNGTNKPIGKCTGEGADGKKAAAKMADDDDEGKMAPPMKTSSAVYGFFGSGDGFEFYGEYTPKGGDSDDLECKYKVIKASMPAITGAAAAAASGGYDDDDVEEDADEGVDFNELIALHEDAGMSVDQLKKRYRSGDNRKAAPAPKKVKTDDSDDDDIGF